MYFQPESVEEAVALIAETGAAVLAGGTDFYPALGDRPLARPVCDISRIGTLSGIVREAGRFRINAGATWTDLVRADLPPLFDGIRAAAREVGSIQIQNVATVAGNVCNASPAADGVPCLMAMDATVEIAGAAGRREMPVADFVRGNRATALAPGELVTALLVPDPGPSWRSSFEKLGSRRYLVISIVSVAATLSVEAGRVSAARVAVGACSAVPRRLPALEAALAGAPAAADAVGSRVLPEHLAPLSPIDDVRGTAAYRNEAALEMVRRALARALDPEAPAGRIEP